jgi:hypothetical protein
VCTVKVYGRSKQVLAAVSQWLSLAYRLGYQHADGVGADPWGPSDGPLRERRKQVRKQGKKPKSKRAPRLYARSAVPGEMSDVLAPVPRS